MIKPRFTLFLFLMNSRLVAMRAVFLHFETFGVFFLIFRSDVILILTNSAS